MRLLVLLAIVAVPATAADRPSPASIEPACKNPGTQRIESKMPRASVHPLNQEPAAKQVLTVMRTADGCVKPVIVREDLGTPRSR